MLTRDSVVTGIVETLAFGGRGILKHEGIVIFIPFTAPGDHVTCRITKVKKTFAEAELIRINQKSALRIPPKCPHFGICGGCQLQHLTIQAQEKQKHLWVQDALSRIGHIENFQVKPCVPAEGVWGYRRHIELNLKPSENAYEAGYISYDGRQLVPIQECLIFDAERSYFFEEIHKVAKRLNNPEKDSARVSVLKNEDGDYILNFHFKTLPDNSDAVLTQAMKEFSKWKGILVGSPKKFLKYGQWEAQGVIAGLKFHYSPEVFLQNNLEQSLKIYQKIVEIALELKVKKMLDLYCGIGITSLMLARQGIPVTGIEYNAKSIELAKLNAKENGLKNLIFYQGQVENRLKTVLQREDFDILLINPPREGIDPQVADLITTFKPKALIYVSCMPSTLARDLAKLSKFYRIEECQPFDMFPQTTHIETLVKLSLVAN